MTKSGIEIYAGSGLSNGQVTSWPGNDCSIGWISWPTTIVNMRWRCNKWTWQWLRRWDGYVISCPRNDSKHRTVMILNFMLTGVATPAMITITGWPRWQPGSVRIETMEHIYRSWLGGSNLAYHMHFSFYASLDVKKLWWGEGLLLPHMLAEHGASPSTGIPTFIYDTLFP